MRLPLYSDNISVELSPHILKVAEDECVAGLKTTGNDVLDVLIGQPL